MRHSDGLTRARVGTKYVVEAHGSFVWRYVEFPDGRTMALARRKAAACTCLDHRSISIIPAETNPGGDNPRVRKTASRQRRLAPRVLA
jgi:hypothetical protein